ncbi:hypothetical protein CEXT_44441 [Caerostris extrusa]|uniref:Uncharacterized protein n=1 Tax=Caerostris extrusa TaxID=172846 RepID=A0AAV4NXG1_CAEEX|nr:hypothetical protein CEXT_44441 [Caerostris extrusa]
MPTFPYNHDRCIVNISEGVDIQSPSSGTESFAFIHSVAATFSVYLDVFKYVVLQQIFTYRSCLQAYLQDKPFVNISSQSHKLANTNIGSLYNTCLIRSGCAHAKPRVRI